MPKGTFRLELRRPLCRIINRGRFAARSGLCTPSASIRKGKLVRAIIGTVFDVVVGIRRCSPTFRRWISVEISAENFRQIYVPPGFAHGICVLSEVAEIAYKCTDYYDPADELRIIWNDPNDRHRVSDCRSNPVTER
jgi:dTDP-4-dehydrorhamnose 3,5-epimerase